MELCFLCDAVCVDYQRVALQNHDFYRCNNCGAYSLYDSAKSIASENKHLLAGYLYETNRHDKSYVEDDDLEISSMTIKKILSDGRIPKTPMQRLERLLLNLYKISDKFGDLYFAGIGYKENSDNPNISDKIVGIGVGNVTESILTPRNYPISIAYARDFKEVENMFECLEDLGYLKEKDKGSYIISPKGFERAEQLLSTNIDSKKVFVAMWYSDETVKMRESIKNAIIACGFELFIVDEKPFNGYITDEIISGIKQCKFMIADLTGYRGGVYWEAGFAKGLGREVILTCRKDWCEGDPKENKRIHFDLDHILRIEWEEDKLADFEKALKFRIIRTIDGAVSTNMEQSEHTD